ncbi:hypothetical protein FRX31_022527 [Thalictrum thalictroides]|uniref:Uncharacterized protein n=1 Tax=Thalictrum thalictroides TaxID=46969 RepID=A0A7J6VUN8_THATH|nr:hypothetical protein FRX31_022527 [Thalictrum thalictroides]
MNSEGLKSVLKDFKDGIFEKKTPHGHSEIDSTSALQSFLNHIPVESIPRIRTTQVLILVSSILLEWFYGRLRFESDGCPFCIYGDQSIAEAFHSLWENKKDQIAVLNRETAKLVGVMGISR